MTANKLIDSLLLQSEKDYQTASDLFKKKYYTYALFFGQLTLEKLLKALIIRKKNKVYPPIHSLTKLASIAGLDLTSLQREDLEEITSFNIKARYDDIKLSFFQKATEKYTLKWISKIKEYRKWLKSLF